MYYVVQRSNRDTSQQDFNVITLAAVITTRGHNSQKKVFRHRLVQYLSSMYALFSVYSAIVFSNRVFKNVPVGWKDYDRSRKTVIQPFFHSKSSSYQENPSSPRNFSTPEMTFYAALFPDYYILDALNTEHMFSLKL